MHSIGLGRHSVPDILDQRSAKRNCAIADNIARRGKRCTDMVAHASYGYHIQRRSTEIASHTARGAPNVVQQAMPDARDAAHNESGSTRSVNANAVVTLLAASSPNQAGSVAARCGRVFSTSRVHAYRLLTSGARHGSAAVAPWSLSDMARPAENPPGTPV